MRGRHGEIWELLLAGNDRLVKANPSPRSAASSTRLANSKFRSWS
jgi:hypothetical protein